MSWKFKVQSMDIKIFLKNASKFLDLLRQDIIHENIREYTK